MTPDVQNLHNLVTELLQATDPVTFYEILTVVNVARPIAEPDMLTLNLLAQLYDAPQLTDGARDALAPFLKGHVQRIKTQQALAQRPILLKDTGKTARAARHSVLLVSLEERRASGFLWRISTLSTGAQCNRLLDRADAPNRAEFELELPQVGHFDLGLTEDLNVSRPTRSQSAPPRPRHFDLHIVVEEI